MSFFDRFFFFMDILFFDRVFFFRRGYELSAMDRSMTESFLLDTSVASLILNGELWERSPATLMGSKPDIYAAWRLGDEDSPSPPGAGQVNESLCMGGEAS